MQAKLSMLKNSSMSAAGDNAKVKRTSKSDKKIVNSVTKPTPGGLNNIAPRKPQAKLKTRGTAEGKMNSSSIDDTDGSKSIGEAEPSLRIPKNKVMGIICDFEGFPYGYQLFVLHAGDTEEAEKGSSGGSR